MPRERSIKQLLGETVIFVSMFALAGHLSINFWDKYVIQSELTHMKRSLHSMKNTIHNIGIAYDNLYKELKGLKHVTYNKPQSKQPIHRQKYTNTVIQKTHNDMQVHAVVTQDNKSCVTHNNEERNVERNKNLMTSCDATTVTRYPAKSNKVGSDSESNTEEENCQYIICDNKQHNCYKQCGECQHLRYH